MFNMTDFYVTCVHDMRVDSILFIGVTPTSTGQRRRKSSVIAPKTSAMGHTATPWAPRGSNLGSTLGQFGP